MLKPCAKSFAIASFSIDTSKKFRDRKFFHQDVPQKASELLGFACAGLICMLLSLMHCQISMFKPCAKSFAIASFSTDASKKFRDRKFFHQDVQKASELLDFTRAGQICALQGLVHCQSLDVQALCQELCDRKFFH